MAKLKIALITAGAAGMYCGSCIQDNLLVLALRKQGHDAILLPTYTPIRTDEIDASAPRVFMGGINVYLQQKFRLFRHMPKWLNRLMDFPPLLRWVSRFAVSTKAEELGDLTLSMLNGQKGYQSSEIADLADWLKNHFKPDVVHFSNLLLSGLAGSIKDATGAKIVGTLQGDDIFLESLPEQFRQQAIQLIRKNSTTFDAITATSTSYANRMSLYLSLEREKISTILPGIAVPEFSGSSQGAGKTIGYFARICPEKGFHLLVDAWIELRKKNPQSGIKLKASGWLGQNQSLFFKQQMAKVNDANLAKDFDYVSCPNGASKSHFYESVDILCVPSPYLEPKGLYVLEAWSHGVPVLQPDHGSFPELMEKAVGGGWLFKANQVGNLSEKMDDIFQNQGQIRAQGEIGRNAVKNFFNSARMAEQVNALYSSLLQQ
jgi:glycosyltransferase involved in cell wall biosynthesis